MIRILRTPFNFFIEHRWSYRFISGRAHSFLLQLNPKPIEPHSIGGLGIELIGEPYFCFLLKI